MNCLTRPSLRTWGQAIAGAQPNVQRHHQGHQHQSQWSLLPYATPPIHGLFPLPKEVGPVMLQGAYGTCRHPMRGGRSGTRSGWTVDSGSLERRPYRMPSTLDSMRVNKHGSRWLTQAAAFNAAFLQTISQMVQGFAHRDPELWSGHSSPCVKILF